MDSVTIGLDIGSSAVRAAEVSVTKEGKRMLRRYAQVGLPHGYVSDGEINNIPGVTAALKRLWVEGGFTTNKVVLGISGPRVFIRQAEVPALRPEDLRSSLKFDAQELVPIAMDDACFDFSILDPAPQADANGKTAQTILLVAAHRDLLRTYGVTLREAGLQAVVMDAAPLALVRAVPVIPSGHERPALEVIVSVGSELTTVAVREGGVPRFIRSLTVGGTKLTETIANSLHIELAVAERLKRGSVPADNPQLGQARRVMAREVREVAEEIRATIDFFTTQSDGADIDRLVITGGGAQTENLAHVVAGNLPVPIATLDPLAQLDTTELPYDDAELRRIGASAATAIGLALWPTDAPLIRLTLLPEEVRQARHLRRLVAVAGSGLAGLVALLGVVGAGEILAVHHAQAQAKAAEQHATVLTGEVTNLEAKTAVHGQMETRSALVSGALQGDVDWVRVIGQLATVMPPSLSLTELSASRTAATSGSGSTAKEVGGLSLSVKGNGGLPAAASWLAGLESDPDLSNVNVAGITVKNNGGPVTFTSTAQLTPTSQSNRDKGVPK